MRRHHYQNARVLILVPLMGLMSSPGRADDGAMSGVGGSVHLMSGHPSVRMVDEVVRFTIPSCQVEARFTFNNDGKPCWVLMGFPERGYGDGEPTGKRVTAFKGFRAYVDGTRVLVARKVAESGDMYRFWWVKRVHFNRGQTRIVVNRYTGGKLDTTFGQRGFTYTLTTGASWKGPIGHARIICHLRHPGKAKKFEFSPGGYHRVGNTITWNFRHFKPKHEIAIAWRDS